MNKIKRLLTIIFLLPILPIIGIPGAGSGDAGGADGGSDAGGQDEGADDGKVDEGADKEVTMKQADLDALIDRAFKKGAKKAQKNTEKKTETQDPKADDQLEKLNKANMKAAGAEVKAAMAIAGIKPEKIARAYRLIDIDAVMEDGEVDSDLLESEVEDLLKDFPELKQTTESEGKGFKFGAEAKQDKEKKKPIQRIF